VKKEENDGRGKLDDNDVMRRDERKTRVKNETTKVGEKFEGKIVELKNGARTWMKKARQQWTQAFAEKEESPRIQMIRTQENKSSEGEQKKRRMNQGKKKKNMMEQKKRIQGLDQKKKSQMKTARAKKQQRSQGLN
jgi:hypothetical protein